ncbi:MAG TPA: hypothetical protein VKP30_13195 [Polyangiaceae bacterium]|nr:hypothetical protein [Polyangiaceae bacterium]
MKSTTVDRWLLLEVAGNKGVTEDGSSTSLRRESLATQVCSFAGGVAVVRIPHACNGRRARSYVHSALNISDPRHEPDDVARVHALFPLMPRTA